MLCTLAFLTPLHTGTTATQTLLCHTRLIIAACATLYLSFISTPEGLGTNFPTALGSRGKKKNSSFYGQNESKENVILPR